MQPSTFPTFPVAKQVENTINRHCRYFLKYVNTKLWNI